jgi:hypothetical protein
MSDHLLWAEVPDAVNPGDTLRAYSFFGHPSQASGIFAPIMDSAYLLTPLGKRVGQDLKKGWWLPGYGRIEYMFSDIVLTGAGDYVFSVIRSPGVYDLAWHGGESGPFMSHNFAKAIIHAGNELSGMWNAGFPLELIPQRAPYDINAGQDLTLKAEYLGRPVKARFYASYWTWDEQGDERVQRGVTEVDGSFIIRLTQSGLWIIDVGYTLADSGTWTATYSNDKIFRSGDMVPYETTRLKTTLSIWVR